MYVFCHLILFGQDKTSLRDGARGVNAGYYTRQRTRLFDSFCIDTIEGGQNRIRRALKFHITPSCK